MKNQLKTAILLALLTALLLWVGQLIGGYSGLVFAGFFAVLMNFGAFWFSDKIVLMMYRAKEVTEKDQPILFKIVRDVTHKANTPMPKVYIIPSENANAFATGRSKNHAAVACTQGILNLLKEDELKGVIAHEVAHIQNKDILISTIAGTIAGVISYVAFMARWAAIFGGSRDDDRGGNIISLLLLAIVTPIVATLIQLAISRSREYLADETGARIIRSPYGLASALEKLESDAKKHPMRFGNTSTAHLFITNPFRSGGFIKLFQTHPDMASRIKRLKNMKI
ncbi:zinc metalloprotease HtpX [Candidatus Woesearchaeota archaeon]|nr:zinc metalloprotease HtpX [Candidatus Woesearchaeota archaeon]